MSSAYVIGEVVRLLLSTFDFAGAVADPGAVVLKVKQPDGTPFYENTFQFALLKKEWQR